MQTSSIKRKRLTSAQREELLDRYQASGLTQRDFAQQHGIGLSTLQNWLRKASRIPPAGAPSFLPVPNLLAASPLPSAYRLQWPGGLALEVRAGFVAQELAALLQLLPAL